MADPLSDYLRRKGERTRRFYDAEAARYPTTWTRKNPYYYQQLKQMVAALVPPGRRVLEIGCGIGHMLDAARPAHGVGIDLSPEMVEQARSLYPSHAFHCMDIEDVAELDETFDYVLAVNTLTEVADVQRCLVALRSVVTAQTRLVILTHNFRWEPVLRAGARLGMRPRSPEANWFSPQDYDNLLAVSGFEALKDGFRMLLPRRVPGLTSLANRIGTELPGIRTMGVAYYMVCRPLVPRDKAADELTVSVIVPCKDEVDNVLEVARRVPQMGAGTEIVFVDDHSTDGTAEAVRAAMKRHPEQNIKLVEGPGRGKGAAVRAGYDAAENDIYMILDADMTVMPEALPAFFDVIASGRAEFINGSRQVYPMEDEAMRLPNIVGNWLFAMAFSYLLEQPVKDTLCGTKVFFASDYDKILETRQELGDVDRWGDFDLLFGAARHHLKILDLPTHYVARTAGETKMTNRLGNARVMLRMCRLGYGLLKRR